MITKCQITRGVYDVDIIRSSMSSEKFSLTNQDIYLRYNNYYKLVQWFSKKVQNYFELHGAKKELQISAGLPAVLFRNHPNCYL